MTSDPTPMVDGTPVDDAVQVLRDLAAGGRTVELAIGRGRVAIPLAALACLLLGAQIALRHQVLPDVLRILHRHLQRRGQIIH